jgi:glycogen debranching enzyme
MSRWTRFWLDQRRVAGHELPYYQHGNDSGWDNATTFDSGRVLQTADLAAFLVIQLHELAGLAAELGETSDAEHWTTTAHTVSSAMLERLWSGTRFLARRPADGQAVSSTSLLDLMPITLGSELPEQVREQLTAALRAHLTDNGLATEPVSSPHYDPDGYWRGPIWAPSTVLIEDGLRRGGHDDLADEISERFRALCEKSGVTVR